MPAKAATHQSSFSSTRGMCSSANITVTLAAFQVDFSGEKEPAQGRPSAIWSAFTAKDCYPVQHAVCQVLIQAPCVYYFI